MELFVNEIIPVIIFTVSTTPNFTKISHFCRWTNTVIFPACAATNRRAAFRVLFHTVDIGKNTSCGSLGLQESATLRKLYQCTMQ